MTFNFLLQVSKPYTSFFTDENLGSMKLETGEHDEVDNNANLHGNLGDVDHEQVADDPDYGDEDGDMEGFGDD